MPFNDNALVAVPLHVQMEQTTDKILLQTKVNADFRRDSGVSIAEEDASVVKFQHHPECNLVGLNGLAGNGLDGLSTGTFMVEAVMPVRYTIEVVTPLFDIVNKTLLRTVDDAHPPQLSTATSLPSSATQVRRFIVIDANVCDLYNAALQQYFAHHNVQIALHRIKPDEENKNIEQVLSICTAMQKFNIDRRREPIIAIGGGVTLDIAGLAANLYRRNTPIIKVPTTLIGMVDAAVGVKTAVNLNGGKNKIGTYCAPLAVFVDISFLRTLADRHVRNGSAEILKMACVKDYKLFVLLEEMAKDPSSFKGDVYLNSEEIMRRAIQGMLEELEPNLWEFNLRRVVDYGHTFSPCLEMAALSSESSLLHGEAVCIDMALTTIVARNRGLLSSAEAVRVINLMRNLGLAISHPKLTSSCCAQSLKDVTAGRGGFQRTPLMHGIGEATFVDDLTIFELEKALCNLNNI
ncbi:Dehydroquinate synthase-like protein [Fimicolochytrium jonesii]|uniref:Dehydroquinate synthase-like protein n=1 Tax=Fimicolochytrium jonesii TaxID=1396493 RepID=UPI0022FE9901|nr:Dehydroquinate synthase-like protein [Fimicolochytrium jonesii]KAI8826904.1 Dehydroquinate synthase-like protein [Fimicolochytrium jonesii]